MTNPNKLLPMLLPTRPSCNDCLSWCQDHLAVAGGEFVHILTPKASLPRPETAGHPDWHIFSLRVNLFNQTEWPNQVLDTIRDFSIGEEQTYSLVGALAWSGAGIGVHRQSVLAVLTSNLVLSIWETDGTPSHYERTCVINNCPAFTGDEPDRRARRVRSFAWLPVLATQSSPRWGFHHLVVANDRREIIILRLSKPQHAISADWNVHVSLKFSLQDLDMTQGDTTFMSPLQRRLHRESPINKIVATAWSDQIAFHNELAREEDASETSCLLGLNITTGNSVYKALFYARISDDGQEALLSQAKNKNSKSESSRNDASPDIWSKSDAPWATTSEDVYFKDAAQPLQDDFDTTFQLFGHFRTRYWGSTISPDSSQAAACITLHPSDMIEYTIPSAEKCTIIFKNTNINNGARHNSPASSVSVQESILAYACKLLDEGKSIASPLDMKLSQTYGSLAHVSPNLSPNLKAAWKQLERSVSAPAMITPLQEDAQNGELQGDIRSGLEQCDICGASIPFTAAFSKAICSTGHQFRRCQLTFLPIQEPGISKYCSQCGKEFLDLSKLGSTEGSSFTRAMFDEFDVCPYCQAKFRG